MNVCVRCVSVYVCVRGCLCVYVCVCVQGVFQRWQKRYFVLLDNYLSYYKKEEVKHGPPLSMDTHARTHMHTHTHAYAFIHHLHSIHIYIHHTHTLHSLIHAYQIRAHITHAHTPIHTPANNTTQHNTHRSHKR